MFIPSHTAGCIALHEVYTLHPRDATPLEQPHIGNHVIVGTAGHIDHGKSSLVKALTGIDADRLKEEKERGITVDLGFAYKKLTDGGVLGFIDVPGHEKLVRNMLAGATGIDHVMLVIAADDGPMPQTLEHLAILDLLGLSSGIVALTKSDLVSAARIDEVSAQIRALLADTALAHADVLPVSSTTGLGIDALSQHLTFASLNAVKKQGRGHFRLAVDRSFTLTGVGTVVTGTAVSGHVAIGDKLLVTPRNLPVRVRGLHVHDQVSAEGRVGQRLAINLAGIEKTDVQRGDWIVAESAHSPTQRIDARLRVLASEAKALAHWTPVHFHLGAVDVGARVVLLEGQPIAPGTDALVQLHLDRPIGALHGDRFILRDQSALRTMGGGAVIDIFAPDTRRRKAPRLAALRALEQPAAIDAMRALLALALPNGIAEHAFFTLWNLLPEDQAALLGSVPHRLIVEDKTRLIFAPGQVERVVARITDRLAAHHVKSPDSPGMTQEQLQRALTDKPSATVFALLLRELVKDSTLKRSGANLRLAGHDVTLQGPERQLWERLKPWLDEGGIHPPKLSDMLMRDRALRKDQVLRVLQRLERMGKVHAVGAEYFIQTHHMLELALQSQALAEKDANKRLNVKEMREAMGVSRHLSVPLVEFFDQVGFTKRDELGRHIRRDPRKMFDGGT